MINKIPEELDKPYPITDKIINDFNENGFIYLPSVLSKETVDFFRADIVNTTNEYFEKKKPSISGESYKSYFRQVTNLWQKNDKVKSFVFSKRLAGIAVSLLKCNGIRLYHDQALIKEPGGLSTPWHQDQFYWPLTSPKTITMWMPLVDCPLEMGPITFAKKSHIAGQLADTPISSESDTIFQKLIAEKNFELISHNLQAGDATFHFGWTLHSTTANKTEKDREVMTIIYFEDGNLIREPVNKYQKVDLEAFHPGQKPGEKASSHLNPLLFNK